MRTLVLGLGYVGLPLAVRAAEVGHSVVGVDLDQHKIASIRSGVSYIEDVSDERLVAATSKKLVVSDRLLSSHSAFDVAVIAVPTPLRENSDPDLSYVLAAAEEIGRIMEPGCTVVLESTTYPGTTEGWLADTLARASGMVPGKDFHLGYSPERVDPGNSAFTLENTPKLVSGTTVEALLKVQKFYDTIVDETVPVSSPRVAEMAKVFENIQAYVAIALINELAEICHDLGIDVHEMNDAAMTKGHSMIYWTPGPGVGGHCLPIDPVYLSWLTRERLGRPFRMAELAADINNTRPHYVVDRAEQMLTERSMLMRGSKVLVMGVAYKPDVGDLRESPALPIITDLTGRGAAVTVVDPHLNGAWTLTPRIGIEDLTATVKEYDLVIVVTDHAVFDYDKVATEAQLVLDCRNSMRPSPTVVPL